LGDKVTPEDKSKAEEAIASLRKALEGGDIEAIKGKTEALKQVSYKIAEEIYKQQGSAGQQQGSGPGAEQQGFNPNTGGSSGGGDGNTKSAEDADYEVVD
jgi:molecular chaperone DnaK